MNKFIKKRNNSQFNKSKQHISYKTLYILYAVVKVQNVCVHEIFGGVRMNVVIISPRLLKFGDMVSLVGRASAESLAEIRMD